MKRGSSRCRQNGTAYRSFILVLLGFLTHADSMKQQMFVQGLNILVKEQIIIYHL